VINFGGDPDLSVDSGSLFFTIAEYGIFGHLLAFHIHSTADLYTILGEMTDVDKIIHPQHFGTDPTDVWIRIRIIPKIRIRISDHFCCKFWRWGMFAFSECSCLYLWCNARMWTT